MRSLHLATISAIDERRSGQKDVAAAIALAVSADPLLW
jgi:hypothetical protein